MIRLGIASFADREAAEAARRALEVRGEPAGAGGVGAPGERGVREVRVHVGSLDPLVGVDMSATRSQRRRDRQLLWRGVAPLLAGLLLGFLAGQLTPLPVGVTTWVAGAVGLVVGVVLPRGPAAAWRRADKALRRGRAVLTVAYDRQAAAGVLGTLREHGGRILTAAA